MDLVMGGLFVPWYIKCSIKMYETIIYLCTWHKCKLQTILHKLCDQISIDLHCQLQSGDARWHCIVPNWWLLLFRAVIYKHYIFKLYFLSYFLGPTRAGRFFASPARHIRSTPFVSAHFADRTLQSPVYVLHKCVQFTPSIRVYMVGIVFLIRHLLHAVRRCSFVAQEPPVNYRRDSSIGIHFRWFRRTKNPVDWRWTDGAQGYRRYYWYF